MPFPDGRPAYFLKAQKVSKNAPPESARRSSPVPSVQPSRRALRNSTSASLRDSNSARLNPAGPSARRRAPTGGRGRAGIRADRARIGLEVAGIGPIPATVMFGNG